MLDWEECVHCSVKQPLADLDTTEGLWFCKDKERCGRWEDELVPKIEWIMLQPYEIEIELPKVIKPLMDSLSAIDLKPESSLISSNEESRVSGSGRASPKGKTPRTKKRSNVHASKNSRVRKKS